MTTAAAAEDWHDWPEEKKRRLRARLLHRRRRPWQEEARPNQLPPPGDWFIWLILAGRGWGKTRVGAEWIADKARQYPGTRNALVAQTFADGRDTMVEGESGLLTVFGDHELRGGAWDTAWNRSMGELYLANGSRFKIFSSEKPDRLRGPQHHFVWGDEPFTWFDAEKGPSVNTTWNNLDIGCRLAVADSEPQIILTGTPQPVELLIREEPEPVGLIHDPRVVVTRGHTEENLDNLAQSYRERVIEPLKGTRIARQELAGEILYDVPGALFKMEWIDTHRATREPYAGYRAKTVALDPSDGTASGDEQAIAVCGLGMDNDFYVLVSEGHRDKTITEWITRGLQLAAEHGAKLVVEKNHGGEPLMVLIRQVMAQTGIRAPMKAVSASQGKRTRAEPVANLYEGGAARTQGRVRHLGYFRELEQQMTSWLPGGKSPDRLDALVWSITDLMGYGAPPGFGGEGSGVASYDQPAAGVVRWG